MPDDRGGRTVPIPAPPSPSPPPSPPATAHVGAPPKADDQPTAPFSDSGLTGRMPTPGVRFWPLVQIVPGVPASSTSASPQKLIESVRSVAPARTGRG